MAQPWKILDSIDTAEGLLELRQRAEGDFLITLGGLVLMNSMANRSEVVLGQLACRHLRDHPAPRVLVGGLGMGFTLRAVLDSLPARARVVVSELNPVVVNWCRGPLARLTDNAVGDPRATIEIGDVAELVRRSAKPGPARPFDAIVFDLYRGPHFHSDPVHDPLYGSRAIGHVRNALGPGGFFAVWGETFDEGFARRLIKGGFRVDSVRPGRGGLRHVVFLAERLDTVVRQAPPPRRRLRS
jgi:spermidine synthase